jgi:hypothetical protein
VDWLYRAARGSTDPDVHVKKLTEDPKFHRGASKRYLFLSFLQRVDIGVANGPAKVEVCF